MPLQEELGYPFPVKAAPHEALMNILYTGTLLAKEGYKILRPHGLTDSQFNLLMLLKYQSDEDVGLTQTELGSMLLVNRSNVTGLIDRLEHSGWVERSGQANDRRVKRIRLTKKGRQKLESAEEVYYRRVTEIMGALSEKEQKQLTRLLEKVRERIASE